MKLRAKETCSPLITAGRIYHVDRRSPVSNTDRVGIVDDRGQWVELLYSRFVEVEDTTTSTVEVKQSNPKEAIGDSKLNLSLVPDTVNLYLAIAFTEGALKYGSYNWRAAGVRASTYIAANRRHVSKWWNGEDFDPKTKVHHLANAMACLGIILDAEAVGLLTDDRPPKADVSGLIEKLEATVAHLKTMSAGLHPHHHTQANAK